MKSKEVYIIVAKVMKEIENINCMNLLNKQIN